MFSFGVSVLIQFLCDCSCQSYTHRFTWFDQGCSWWVPFMCLLIAFSWESSLGIIHHQDLVSFVSLRNDQSFLYLRPAPQSHVLMLGQLARNWSAEGQSDSIVADIENMVRSYVEKVLISIKLNSVSDGFFIISGRCSNSCYSYMRLWLLSTYICVYHMWLCPINDWCVHIHSQILSYWLSLLQTKILPHLMPSSWLETLIHKVIDCFSWNAQLNRIGIKLWYKSCSIPWSPAGRHGPHILISKCSADVLWFPCMLFTCVICTYGRVYWVVPGKM